MLYKIVSIISVIVRSFLPNPYINLFNGNEILAYIFNVIAGSYILYKLSFWLTGFAYNKRRDSKEFGSIGYIFSYVLLTCIITLLGRIITRISLMIIIFIVIYFILCFLAHRISKWHRYF